MISLHSSPARSALPSSAAATAESPKTYLDMLLRRVMLQRTKVSVYRDDVSSQIPMTESVVTVELSAKEGKAYEAIDQAK